MRKGGLRLARRHGKVTRWALIGLAVAAFTAVCVLAQVYSRTDLRGGGFSLVVAAIGAPALPLLAALIWKTDNYATTAGSDARRRGWYEGRIAEVEERSWSGAGEAAAVPLLLIWGLVTGWMVVDQFRVRTGGVVASTLLAVLAGLTVLAATLALWQRPRCLLPGVLRTAYRLRGVDGPR